MAYLDSVLVFTTSFFLPHHNAGFSRIITPGDWLYGHKGVLGATFGALLFFLVYDHSQLQWFLYLAAAQAAGTAITEFMVARATSIHHGSRWCYASGEIAALSTVALLCGLNREPQQIAWLLFGYLGVFGLTLTLLSGRMLFAEVKVRHLTTLREAALVGAL